MVELASEVATVSDAEERQEDRQDAASDLHQVGRPDEARKAMPQGRREGSVMIESQPSRVGSQVDLPQAPVVDGAAEPSTDKVEKAAEKGAEKAEKDAEKQQKEGDRLAKLYLDGDNTLLRWLRTSLFLVTTGIGVERGLQYLEQTRAGPSLDPYAVLRMVALGLVLLGIGSLWLACVDHLRELRAIRHGDSPPLPSFSLSLWVSGAVAIMSVIAFLAILASYVSGQPLIG
jgi:uncharacterized membrane protein YidH (DUF202 family)